MCLCERKYRQKLHVDKYFIGEIHLGKIRGDKQLYIYIELHKNLLLYYFTWIKFLNKTYRYMSNMNLSPFRCSTEKIMNDWTKEFMHTCESKCVLDLSPFEQIIFDLSPFEQNIPSMHLNLFRIYQKSS